MSDQPVVDLRSDTVTRPTAEMRRAMADAEVGDDVFGEDPTVRRLEEGAAARMGTQAALFVPTGTMGNQLALYVHGRPGSEVILELHSHILNYERAALAVLSGMLPRVVISADGWIAPEQVREALRPDDVVHAPTTAIALENTHNMAGGRVVPLEAQRAVQEVARAAGVPVHLDGARIFNAAVALGVAAGDVARGFDSVMFCLSKGLGAPVGSLLCGSRAFVDAARKARKMLGGGMRQAGVLAAAGLVALERMPQRLEEDHVLARRLAEELANLDGLELVVPPETNIVLLRVLPDLGATTPGTETQAAAFVTQLARRGVLALPIGPERVRLVTHYDLPADSVARTVAAAAAALR